MPERKIAVFCSASYDISRKYHEAAREAVRALHSYGYTLVSGGTVKGMMGTVADESARCGGRHVGVVPRFMKDLRFPGLDEVVWTDTMAERKTAMREGTEAVVALPGGIGTLDELIETLVLKKLGKYDGWIYALNQDGFYEPLKRLLDHYVHTGMMPPADRELIQFPDTVAELTGFFNG